MSGVESTFATVAEPNRRAILQLLLEAERSVGELEQELQLSQPSVSKHLRVLREAGYTGELRAQGDVLVDQMPLMKRCGFDSFAPQAEIDPATLEAALTRYENVYQRAADGRVPVWALRHG